MEIFVNARTLVNLIDSTDHAACDACPDDADRDCLAAWYAGKDDPGHAVGEPTPVEVLDHDAGRAPWWATLPECPELDTPIGLGPDAPCWECDGSGWRARPDGHASPCPACNAPTPRRRSSRVSPDEERAAYGY
jgi:hypothetical protein